jgi:hypothetical protein
MLSACRPRLFYGWTSVARRETIVTMLLLLLLLLLLLFFFVSYTAACHPECVYILPNTTLCPASCTPLCKPPNCTVECTNPLDAAACISPICHDSCPPDQCESDECPECEVLCDPLFCMAGFTDCEILCEEIECSWECHVPSAADCPPPIPILVCEDPACKHSGATLLSLSLSTIMVASLFY